MNGGVRILCWIVLACAATGCTSTVPKNAGGYYLDDGPPQNLSRDIAEIPDAQPRLEPLRPGTLKPYDAFGQRYVPMTRLEPYRAQGRASWYGRRYHGQPTASGERYDMLAMTAAHPTLPIPSYVRVTNRANGRSVVVRVNDRGPFHGGRLIDLSYAAATRLDLVLAGGGDVDVELLIPSESTASSNKSEQLQLGAYQSLDNARAAQARLSTRATWVAQKLFVTSRNGLHKLMAGPFASREEARQAAERIEQDLSIRPIISEYIEP